MRQTYLDAQREILESIPMHPFELTEAGLKRLRKNIIISGLSMAAVFGLAYYGIDWGMSETKASLGDNIALRLSVLGVYLSALILALWVMTKSSDYVLATGLYWRISVSDELQDEWELAQKRKSYAKAFEYVIYGMCILFLLALSYCGIHRLIAGTLPPAPSLLASSFFFAIFIFVAAISPLIHLAWTLEPIEDEVAEGRPVPLRKPKREKPLTKKEKRLKMLWDYGPYVVGGIVGVWLVAGGSDGAIYNIGYDLGHWFGSLLKSG